MEKKMANRLHVAEQNRDIVSDNGAPSQAPPPPPPHQIVESPARNGSSGMRRPSRGSIESGRGSDSSRGTPGKSRLGTASQADEYAEGTVPRFGEWEDKNNTSAVEGYTKVFNRVSKERPRNMPGGGGYVPSPYRGATKQTDESTSCCCFCWGRK